MADSSIGATCAHTNTPPLLARYVDELLDILSRTRAMTLMADGLHSNGDKEDAAAMLTIGNELENRVKALLAIAKGEKVDA